MGSKSAAKIIMTEAGIPLVPGYHGTSQDDALLQHEADQIGYPLLIKAVAGGGGKGMRVVDRPEDFLTHLAGARREGLASFGNSDVLIEKYLIAPRHVEVQVFVIAMAMAFTLATAIALPKGATKSDRRSSCS